MGRPRLVFACTLALAVPALADSKPPVTTIVDQAAKDAKLFSFDYGVPESPALALAGLGTDKIKPATSLKPFVLSLPGLFDASGSGSAALDVSPLWLMDPEASAFNYSVPSNYWNRVLARARLGLALYRGDDAGGNSAKAKPSRAALGLSFSLSDGADPLTAGPATFLVTPAADAGQWDRCLNANENTLMPYVASDPRIKAVATDLAMLDMLQPGPAGMASTKSRIESVELNYYVRKGLSVEMARSQIAQRAAAYTDTAAGLGQRIADDRALLEVQGREFDREPERTAYAQARLKTLQACQKQSSAAAEHGFDLQFGAGVVWSGTPGKWGGFSHSNPAVWMATRLPLDAVTGEDCGPRDKRSAARQVVSCWMIGGSGRYSLGEYDATGVAARPQFKANVAEGWVGLERVSAATKFGGYVGYLNQHAATLADKSYSKSGYRWLVSGAMSLGVIYDGLWLVGSYGAAHGSVTTLDDKVALLSLSFGPPKIGSTFVDNSQ